MKLKEISSTNGLIPRETVPLGQLTRYGTRPHLYKEIKEKKSQEEASKQAKVEPVVEQKIETPVPVTEIKVEAPVVEPVHTAVTAPTEAVVEAPVVETPVAEIKIEENKVS